MKNSDKVRLALAVMTGVLAIILLIVFKDRPEKSGSREADIDAMQLDIASSGLTLEPDTGTQASAGVSVAAQDASVKPAAASAAGSADSAAIGVTRSLVSTAAATGASGNAAKAAVLDVSGNSLYRAPKAEDYGRANAKTKDTAEAVLSEMRGYWESDGHEALMDLWKLDRYTALSAYLATHPEVPFFYSGDVNGEGKPNGRGIAVYSGNRYYFGEWTDGQREGTGEWYQFYPDQMQGAVLFHEYTGTWRNDLPDGEGIDLYQYNAEHMDGEALYPQNVIGRFSEGLYDGDMYVILTDADGNLENWYGKCKKGVWQVIDHADADGKLPVLCLGEDTDQHISMLPALVSGYGVYHVR